jgi:hypothetical protein
MYLIAAVGRLEKTFAKKRHARFSADELYPLDTGRSKKWPRRQRELPRTLPLPDV